MPIFFKRSRASRRDQSLARLENFKKEIVTDAHIIPLEELCVRLRTDPVTGLTPEQAKQIYQKTGPNMLTPPRKTPEIIVYLKILFHGFSILLWIGAFLCFFGVLLLYASSGKIQYDNVILGCVLVFVVNVTSIFTYFQARKSKGVMESFANMIPPKATVIRGGVTMNITCKEIVVGDLIDVKFGDRVPADIRIIHCQNLKVDNAPLTGESEPQTRRNKFTDENFLETKNIAFFSTNVVEGTGRGIDFITIFFGSSACIVQYFTGVVQRRRRTIFHGIYMRTSLIVEGIAVGCGDHTVMGHIAGLTARLKPNKSPMTKELDRFMLIVCCWATTMGIVLGLVSIMLKYSVLETLLFVIGIIVSNVPEGLTATVTVCLTVTALHMASKNCLIKNLDAVETLGSTSVICSDKTGTLTQNRMTVIHIWFSGKVQNADTSIDQKAAGAYSNDPDFKILMRCATLCSRSEFVSGQDDVPIMSRLVRGDASEEAILKFVEISNVFPKNYRARNPKLIEIPFSSSTKYQVSVHHSASDNRCLVVMKGAPEVVLERCDTILFRNATIALSKDMRNTCDAACLRFAELGERVLGFCDLLLGDSFTKDFPYNIEPANFPLRGLRFVGFIAMIDPARPQVPDAVRKCKTAGIRVVMVTGDHPVTAKAIAISVGIITDTAKNVREFKNVEALRTSFAAGGNSLVVHGSLLRELNPGDLDMVLYCYKEIVFARTSPTQKLQIVESFQRLGEIVAVTGDGVNDAPALKRADIGIAMGITGTEVSKQAADMILMDDNFASIIIGIEDGRKIFDNLKKSVIYTLASNIPELVPFIIHSLLGIPLPIGIIAVLCIDLLTDMFPAISFAYEPAESDIMERPPRNPKRDKLVSRKLYFLAYGHLGLIEAVGGFFVYFMVLGEHGFFPPMLLGIHTYWVNESLIIKDDYGQDWTYEERRTLEQKCYSAFLIAIVVMQWLNLLACKTRKSSLFRQGFHNHVQIYALMFETTLVFSLAYLPYTSYLKFGAVSYRVWLYAFPWSLLLFSFDEARKWHIRKYPKGWYQRETFF